jgi:hypothetical protein
VAALIVLQMPSPAPIIVKIIEPPPPELAGIRDVLIGSLGLSGVIFLAAGLLGVVVAVLLSLIRSRRPLDH